MSDAPNQQGEREGIPAEYQPKCPSCGVQPCRLSIISGPEPGGNYFLIEVTCAQCHVLLCVIAMPLVAHSEAIPQKSPFPVPPPNKVWTPS